MRCALVTIVTLTVVGGCTFGALNDYDVQSCDPRKGSQADDDCSRLDQGAPSCVSHQCDAASRRCVLRTRDDDRDGDPPPECGGTDCDDHRATVSARLPEICRDGELVDENCNDVIDEDVVVGKLAEAFAVTNESDVRVDATPNGLLASFVQRLSSGGWCIQVALATGLVRDTCVFSAAPDDTGFVPRQPGATSIGTSGYAAAYVDVGASCIKGRIGYRAFDQAGVQVAKTAVCGRGAALPRVHTLASTSASSEALVFYYETSIAGRDDALDDCVTATAAPLRVARVADAAKSSADLRTPWVSPLSTTSVGLYPPSVVSLGAPLILVGAPHGIGAALWLLDETSDVATDPIVIDGAEGARGVSLAIGEVHEGRMRVAIALEIGCAPQELRVVFGEWDSASRRLVLDGAPQTFFRSSPDFASDARISWLAARQEWLVTWTARGPSMRGMRLSSSGSVIGVDFDVAKEAATAAVDVNGLLLGYRTIGARSLFEKGALACE